MKRYHFSYRHNIGCGCKIVYASNGREAYKMLSRYLRFNGYRLIRVHLEGWKNIGG